MSEFSSPSSSLSVPIIPPATPPLTSVRSLRWLAPVIIPSGALACSLAAMLSAIMFGTIPTCDGTHMKITVSKVSLTLVIASNTAPLFVFLYVFLSSLHALSIALKPDRLSDRTQILASPLS
eukprot:5289047-Pleurochrysis_carterae.AAC.1